MSERSRPRNESEIKLEPINFVNELMKSSAASILLFFLLINEFDMFKLSIW